MPFLAMLSMFGVGIWLVKPWQLSSPKPRSSARMTRILGLAAGNAYPAQARRPAATRSEVNDFMFVF